MNDVIWTTILLYFPENFEGLPVATICRPICFAQFSSDMRKEIKLNQNSRLSFVIGFRFAGFFKIRQDLVRGWNKPVVLRFRLKYFCIFPDFSKFLIPLLFKAVIKSGNNKSSKANFEKAIFVC